jgi:hypothetical protein
MGDRDLVKELGLSKLNLIYTNAGVLVRGDQSKAAHVPEPPKEEQVLLRLPPAMAERVRAMMRQGRPKPGEYDGGRSLADGSAGSLVQSFNSRMSTLVCSSTLWTLAHVC